MAKILKPEDLPAGSMKRTIIHWTGGGPEPSALDLEHYHFLTGQSGRIYRGRHSIADNFNTADGDYAAHTKNCNQGSVGISLCGMLNAREYPFDAGPYPITVEQWDLAARIAAEVCERYDIPVTPRTVLQHGEVEENLGIAQNAKWDCCRLPWQPNWTHRQCGDDFRRRVKAHLDSSDDVPMPIKATVFGTEANGFLADSQAWVALRPLIRVGHFGEISQRIVGEDAPHAIEVMIPFGGDPTGPPLTLPFTNLNGVGYVQARAVARLLDADIDWDGKAKRLTIRHRA